MKKCKNELTYLKQQITPLPPASRWWLKNWSSYHIYKAYQTKPLPPLTSRWWFKQNEEMHNRTNIPTLANHPFGAPMPARTYRKAMVYTDASHTTSSLAYVNQNEPAANIASENPQYKFGFNEQEKDDEIAGNGNINTAMFWEYDTRLGRRWNIDPKPNASSSSYECFGDNPIYLTDFLGDTIRATNEFNNDKTMKKAYDEYTKTDKGKEFLKNYGVGGKYENVAVILDVKIGSYCKSVFNVRNKKSVLFSGYKSDKTLAENSIMFKAANKDSKENYLEFTLNFGNTYGLSTNLAEDIDDFIHEKQHMEITIKQIKENKPLLSMGDSPNSSAFSKA